jgi:hypothetical protein
MHDAVVMRELQRIADRRHDGQRLLRREAARLHRLSQIDSVDVLHQKEVEFARPPEVMHRDDIRVIEFRQGLGFPRKALSKAGVGRVLRSEYLECHKPPERLLTGSVDRSHPATADEFDHF